MRVLVEIEADCKDEAALTAFCQALGAHLRDPEAWHVFVHQHGSIRCDSVQHVTPEEAKNRPAAY